METPQNQEEIKKSPRLLSTIIVALSGLILYSDKVLSFINLQFSIPEKFEQIGMDFNTYIWLMSQTISPVLLIIVVFFKPYKISYIIPLYCYILQMYFIFMDYKIIDDSYLQLYTIGTTLLILVLIYSINRIYEYLITYRLKSAKQKIYENLKKTL